MYFNILTVWGGTSTSVLFSMYVVEISGAKRQKHNNNNEVKELQKTAILGTAHILQQVLM